ncbi:MAG: 30S ribosomal protein S20 [Myxococcales bacterium]|nr:30S ribosomal protein S20 [Myxococcales bacterium]
MANHKSALKRARQTEKRNIRNRAGRSTLRTAVKRFRNQLDAGESVPVTSLNSVMAVVAGAGSKGFITKQTASRTVSRLSKAWHKTQG